MIPLSLSRALRHTFRAVTGAGFVGYFALTGVYAFPFNPLKSALEPLLQSTIGTFFPQTWSLFAPAPVSQNFTLLAQCLDDVDYESVERTGAFKEEWSDLTSPLQAMHQASRLSAYDLLARPQWSAVSASLSVSSDVSFLSEPCKAGDKEACDVIDEDVRRQRDRATRLLTRIGSSFCTETSPADKVVRHVALRARVHSGVPWSKRYTAEPPADRDFDLGVLAYDPSVAPSHVFLGADAHEPE